jgi:glycosyltransferase involved in cell wall biosynthesis
MNPPKVSVLLPAFNAQEYLPAAIDSILTQTFSDFELIVVNDGSTDATAQILARYTDSRLRVIMQANAGLPVSLNRAIGLAQGTYLARQDADDISLPERLAKQVAYLDAHPQCGLLGTWAQIMSVDQLTERSLQHPYRNAEIQLLLLFFNCFVHSSVMLRASTLKQSGLYPEEPEKFPPEDYDLWLRIAKHAEVANLPEVLLHYRELPSSISRTKLELMQARARSMSHEAICTLINETKPSNSVAKLVLAMTNLPTPITRQELGELQTLLQALATQVKTAFPHDEALITSTLNQSADLLTKARQKAQVRAVDRFLPFDLVALLKRWR